jgi:ABC-type multidrug transport system ATPase subunit
MKRRLSVAMALIGNPSIVFLGTKLPFLLFSYFSDEPSSGLDPTSRRNLWEVIDYYKQGRSIILTTHSMEVPFSLFSHIYFPPGSRYIMYTYWNYSQRKVSVAMETRFIVRLQCLGSPVHLKNKFGKGYSLYVNFKKGEIEKGAK